METLKWWQQAVFYQIYPRSFADGNGDGVGDFAGMIAKLDYLRELGIDAIWLSPHYPSPFLDCGYDISDYTAVAPEYGTLGDFRAFLQAAHARGIRVVIDVVLNHSSDQHPWFAESRASRSSPKRDWYIWHDGKDGGPPNNWASIFGGSAWEYDALTGQYYYHAFLKEQPDLNWRNPELRRAMWDAVRFWLDLGVDGLRLDAIATIFEHPNLPDHRLPKAPDQIMNANLLDQADYWQLLAFQLKQPGLHELMRELRALVDSYPGERVLVGEDEDVAFHGADDELHLVFNFPLLRAARLTPAHIRANQAARLGALPRGAWPCNTLGNHDAPRMWSRYGDGTHDDALARLHLALMLTLKGTPFLYYGEEIGMPDLRLAELGQLRDTSALSMYRLLTERQGVPHAQAQAEVLAMTRDSCRSPMQWSGEPNAGFSPAGVQTWLPINANYASGVNVAAQAEDAGSLLRFYQRLLRLRRAVPALVAGDYQALQPFSDAYLAFLRHDAATGQRCLVALNFSDEPQAVGSELGERQARLLFSSHARDEQQLALDALALAPFEIVIAEIG
ncbi:alpha-glucosidase [Kouleothrix sp.]|uniref:alpha-glucosidase n=1 Tax=Kouleothrix sp. TaxID=2779161 RepID=UPI00391ADB13